MEELVNFDDNLLEELVENIELLIEEIVVDLKMELSVDLIVFVFVGVVEKDFGVCFFLDVLVWEIFVLKEMVKCWGLKLDLEIFIV